MKTGTVQRAMRLVLATHNAHKVEELRRILGPQLGSIELVAYDGPEPVEDGDTFEANALMNYLMAQPAIPEYQVRLKWRPGTVAMWDNWATQHYAVADYGREPRKMLRATLKA